MQTGAAYIRVSTADQAELSPDAQKRLIQEYAFRNNILIKEEYIYIDEGISGRKANKRPAFMKMIAMAKMKPRPFDVILVHKFDRFSRSREDSIVYKSLLRKKCGIQVVSITEQMEDDKFSVILEAMLEAMAEYYSLNLAEEVTKGMTEKALRGGFQARPPLGYQLNQKGTIPVIVPEEAQIVKQIFSMYVYENKTLYEITRYLNELGLKTSSNNNFEKRSVRYILENPTYIGYLRWNRTHNASHSVKDPSEWIIKKGPQEPIIDEKTFYTANEQLNKDETFKKNLKSNQKHYLSGLIKCSECGRTLVASSRCNKKSGKVYWNFQCYGYLKGKCLSSHQISENKVKKALLKELYDIFQKEDTTLFYKATSHDINNVVGLLENQLQKNRDKQRRIKTAFINGIDSLREYEDNKSKLEEEHQRIKKQLNELTFTYRSKTDSLFQSETENLTKDSIQYNGTVKNVYEIINDDTFTMQEKNKALTAIIDKIVYDKKEESLSFYYNYY